MALGDSYATTAELKSRLGITDSNDDTQLAEALSSASRGIEKFCGRQFNKTTLASARVYYPRAGCWADVDDFHTTTDLAVKTDEGNDGTYETTWSTSDYQLEPLNGIVDGESGWPYSIVRAVSGRSFPITSNRAPIQVTAQWGWTAVPASVKEATLILAEDVFKLADTPFGAGGFGEFGRIRARENPHVAMLVGAYRRYVALVG